MNWILANEIGLYTRWHSTALKIKRLLIVLPEIEGPVRIGWYFGGKMNIWRMDGSPSDVKPTHWMALPKPPHKP
jgi:hypothetical protein